MSIPQSRLLAETVPLAAGDQLLILNSAADPFVSLALQRVTEGTITLAEDNIATLPPLLGSSSPSTSRHVRHVCHVCHVAFHDYLLRQPSATMDCAVMNLLYQPGNAWMLYGLQVALYALRPRGQLYVVGAKDRGILSLGKRMQEYFGNVETLQISKGQRVLRAQKRAGTPPGQLPAAALQVFAAGKLDEGTRLLLETLQVRASDEALDIGCGSGAIGLHIARLATRGHVTMVDASLAAVAAAQQAIEQSKLSNVCVLPGDGAQAVMGQRFDLVATNPPFHQGGIQTTEIAERFVREAAQVLRPGGRFYLVANRFLKYEPTIRSAFGNVEEAAGDTRYKVLFSTR